MREPYEDWWLRIHSLPQSRRYPETPPDWEELLARHNTVATELLGDGEPCVLVISRFSSQDGTTMPARGDAVPGAPMLTVLGPIDDTWPGGAELPGEDGTLWLQAAELRWRIRRAPARGGPGRDGPGAPRLVRDGPCVRAL